MNVLFLSIGSFKSIKSTGIYPDLLREFRKRGDDVYIVGSYEKRVNKNTELVNEDGVNFLHVKIGNITKCGIIEKGISMLRLETLYKKAIKKYFKGVKFDLILYTTPPITFCNVVKYVKKRDNARTYLMLKDIFPQNAVDIGMLTKSGLKGILYKYFRKKEKKLYALSDTIGCMSQANCDYVIKHNPEINPQKVEVCPNAIEFVDVSISTEEKIAMRQKYDLPLDKKIFVYGGNLGKPQGVPFVIESIKKTTNEDAFFLVVGDGTEFKKLQAFADEYKPNNFRLMKRLPKEDYDRMIVSCDVGMIFLDNRFTIPNFPSRLLSYMQAGLPMLACTDVNTDVGKVITDGGFGWWCQSDDPEKFAKIVDEAIACNDLTKKSKNAIEYLKEHYSVQKEYDIIVK